MSSVKSYLSLIKFSHTIFAMPFAMIGFVEGYTYLKKQSADPTGSYFKLFFLVLICMIAARSAAMAFNRYLDHRIDALNPRTAIREIPAGVIKPQQALLFTILSSVIFIVACFFINPLCFYLSFVALFVVLFYSYTKRFTALCHLVLGLGLSLAPIGAYLALTSTFNWIPLCYSFAVITWVSGFDIIYALQDEHFDASQKLHSMPVLLGTRKALSFSRMLHVVSFLFVCLAGYLAQAGVLYYGGAVVFVGMLMYQHRLVKPDDLSKVNIAFMTANGIASVVFAVFVIADKFIHH